MRCIGRCVIVSLMAVVIISLAACAGKANEQKPTESAALLQAVKRAQPAGMAVMTEKFFAGVGRQTVDYDADGDGKTEKLVVFAREAQVSSDNADTDQPQNKLVILKQNAAGSWDLMWSSLGRGYEVDAVQLLDLKGDRHKLLFFNQKYGVSAGSILDIYSFAGGKMQMLGQFANNKFEAVKAYDKTQLFAVWERESGGAYNVELYAWNGDKIAPAEKYYPEYFNQVADYDEKLYNQNSKLVLYAYYYADALRKAGDFKQAAEIAGLAVKNYASAPNYALQAAVVRAQAYDKLGDPRKAARVLESDMDTISAKWKESDLHGYPKETGDAWYELAMLKQKLGDKKGAKYAAKKAFLLLALMSDMESAEKANSMSAICNN